MAQVDLNDGLAAYLPQKGDPPRNPRGTNNAVKLRRSKIIRRALYEEMDEPCTDPGFEHFTKFEKIIWTLMDRAMAGERWAIALVFNRLEGRVPHHIELKASDKDLYRLSKPELAAKMDALRASLAIDVEPSPPVEEESR